MNLKKPKMTTVKTVHFTIGEDLGIRLMEIAQEHLIYNLNPKKAIETITQSLSGCSNEIALKILKGDMVLPVDVESQEVICIPRESHHDLIFPKLDIPEWYKRKHKEIGENGRDIYRILETLMKEMAENQGMIEMIFSYKSIIDFAGGNVDPMLDELKGEQKIDEIEHIICIAKNYLDTTQKLWQVMDWLKVSYPKLFELQSKEYIMTGRHSVVDMVLTRLTNFLKVNYKEFEEEKKEQLDNLSKFFESTKEIDNVLSKGIKPADMMKGYDAGWLSPDGIYYGLNGEIANMLHNQIATSLVSLGLIPEFEKDSKTKINPDAWLEENGWIKQHGNWILYSGYSLSGKDIPISKKQINMISNFGQICHKGLLSIGFPKYEISATRFEMIEPLQFKMKWFKI